MCPLSNERGLGALAVVVMLVAPAALPAPCANAQQPQPAAQSGMAVRGVYPPRVDAQKIPITAGGFVEGAPVVFDDATERSGLATFVHRSGEPVPTNILEVAASGVALVDVDNDGLLDVYLVNGSTVAALAGKAPPPRAALFRNLGNGRFEDVTARALVANERWGIGVAAGDYDGDGWTDLYVTNYGPNRLYRNRGDGTFEDVAARAGVACGGFSAGASFGDVDGDGLLDLFVAGYVRIDAAHAAPRGKDGAPILCAYRGVPVMCGPRLYPGEPDRLFRNRGDGTFEDVSARAGVADPEGRYGLGAALVDVNGDGRLDIAVANDSVENSLYLNNGDGTFEDVTVSSGFGYSVDGAEQAGMGLGVGDYDNDGRIDFYVTNFSDDFNALYHNAGDGLFDEVGMQSGQGDTTVPFLGWGAGFFDVDNDGWKDLFCVNGHVYPEASSNEWGTTWAQRTLLFRNVKGRFEPVPAATGSGLAVVCPSRGMAHGDLDNDGDVDVVINNLDSPPTLLLGRGAPGTHWLTLSLFGGKEKRSPAVGAVVTCEAAGLRQTDYIVSGGSYASQPDLRARFGLGSATTVDALEVRWPSGRVESFTVPGVDRALTLREGEGRTVSPSSAARVSARPATGDGARAPK